MKRTTLLSATLIAFALPLSAQDSAGWTPGENFIDSWDYDRDGKVTARRGAGTPRRSVCELRRQRRRAADGGGIRQPRPDARRDVGARDSARDDAGVTQGDGRGQGQGQGQAGPGPGPGPAAGPGLRAAAGPGRATASGRARVTQAAAGPGPRRHVDGRPAGLGRPGGQQMGQPMGPADGPADGLRLRHTGARRHGHDAAGGPGWGRRAWARATATARKRWAPAGAMARRRWARATARAASDGAGLRSAAAMGPGYGRCDRRWARRDGQGGSVSHRRATAPASGRHAGRPARVRPAGSGGAAARTMNSPCSTPTGTAWSAREEFVSTGEDWFARFDRDGDGAVTVEDFGPGRR